MGQTLSIRTRADLDELPEVVEKLEAFFDDNGVPMPAANHILMALDEIVANIVEHAYAAGETDPFLKLDAEVDPGQVRMTVADGGVAFDPLARAAPDTTLSVEDRPIGGLGIFLVIKLMDEVAYDRVAHQNRLRIVKNFD